MVTAAPETRIREGSMVSEHAAEARDCLEPRRLASSRAPSWYALLRSSRLRRRPVEIRGNGARLTLWRDPAGRPVAADLRRGGEPWHLTERYGLIWSWMGTAAPLFDLPAIAELADVERPGPARPRVHSFRLRSGAAPVSRILENTFDTVHLNQLHDLRGRTEVTVLDKPAWDRGDPRWPAYVEQSAWFGAVTEIDVERYVIADRAARLLGIPLIDLRVISDYWPSGMVGRVYFGGRHYLTVVGAASPYGPRGGISHGMSITMRAAGALRTAVYHLLFGVQNRLAVRQDVPVWRTLHAEYGGVLVKHDAPIIAFRRWYAGWIESTNGSAHRTAAGGAGRQ